MTRSRGSIAGWLAGRRRRMPDLGAREVAVLQCLWEHGESSAQQVLCLLADEEITLSTIQSTLERLVRKRLLSREKHGRAYRYRPRLTRSELIGALIRDIADDLAGGDLAPMMSGFAEYVGGEAPDIKDGIARLLARGAEADD